MLPSALTPGCLSLMGHLPLDAFQIPHRNFREASAPPTTLR
jgi:hypothetical protein